MMFRPSSNTMPFFQQSGMSHRGVAAKLRQATTDFGSPWRGVISGVRKTLSNPATLRSGALFGFPNPVRMAAGAGRGAAVGYTWGFKGSLPFAVPAAAVMAAMAPRGEAVGEATGTLLGYGLAAIVGGAVGGPIAAFAAQFLLGDRFAKGISQGVSTFAKSGRAVRRVEMGGDYRESQAAYTMRQLASQELSGSLMNARQWLGQEAVFMHR